MNVVNIVEVFIFLGGIYLLAGILFAILFTIFGITTIDETAKGSKIGFRLIIIPGLVLFWPILLKKWLLAFKSNHTNSVTDRNHD